MLEHVSEDLVGKDKIILLCAKTLRLYDPRLIDHGERVAFIADMIFRRLPEGNNIDRKSLLLLCLFHDVGAFKTEEIDRMLQFESVDVHSHSEYGYLFMKYFTPLSRRSEAILYHHTDAADVPEDFEYAPCAGLIHLADRIDILTVTGTPKDKIVARVSNGRFRPEQVEALAEALERDGLYEALADGSYLDTILGDLGALEISFEEALDYLKMLVYTIDFKSKHTLVHSVTTTEISLYLAERCGFDEAEMERVFLGAFMHDVGKLSIPEHILEKPGRLTPEEMDVMKTHVLKSAEIGHDILPPDVCRIAARHHERINGSGYPDGLEGSELTQAEKIVAVADVFSALLGKRSYKEPFDSAKALPILWDMVDENLLDSRLVDMLTEGCDEVVNRVDSSSAPIIAKFKAMREESTLGF